MNEGIVSGNLEFPADPVVPDIAGEDLTPTYGSFGGADRPVEIAGQDVRMASVGEMLAQEDAEAMGRAADDGMPEAEERVYTVEEKLDILAEQFMYLDSQVAEMREAMTSMASALVKIVRAIDAAESKVAAQSNVVLPDGTDISHLNRKQRRDLTFGRTRG